jgi:hypothetical protein
MSIVAFFKLQQMSTGVMETRRNIGFLVIVPD